MTENAAIPLEGVASSGQRVDRQTHIEYSTHDKAYQFTTYPMSDPIRFIPEHERAASRALAPDVIEAISRWRLASSDTEREMIVSELLESGLSLDSLTRLQPHPTLQTILGAVMMRDAHRWLDEMKNDPTARARTLWRIAALPLSRTQFDELGVAAEVEAIQERAYRQLREAGFTSAELREVLFCDMVSLIIPDPAEPHGSAPAESDRY